jgi:hypothetical protein
MITVAATCFEGAPVTGSQFSDELDRYSIVAEVDSTGSGVAKVQSPEWRVHLLLSVGVDPGIVARNPILRVTIRSSPEAVNFSTLRDCVEAVADAWQYRSSVPPLLKCAELLGAQSALSMAGGDWGYELETTIAEDEPTACDRVGPGLTRPSPAVETAPPSSDSEIKAPHARLADELRDMTGLSAAVLGRTFGISREQYSRWISGKPISATRHGQLEFLHTVVRELLRRLGPTDAKVWLHRPIDGVIRPIDLLTNRQFDRFYREVVALSVPTKELQTDEATLPLFAPVEDFEDGGATLEDEPWSPYSTGRSSST